MQNDMMKIECQRLFVEKCKKFEKGIDKLKLECYNFTKFEYHKNDCDEEGRSVTFAESCRLVRDNSGSFRMTYRF